LLPSTVSAPDGRNPPKGEVRVSREFMDRLAVIRAPCAIVRSIDDVRRAFAIWGIETREASR
jgi:hypothetical protein